jgi:site-specific DNA-adenine methylase
MLVYGAVNFFRVLREKKDELIYAIGMTPFSREEFKLKMMMRAL